jgi:hypothetical protein
VRHGIRLAIFFLVAILTSMITKELGGRLDTQIMAGAVIVSTLAGGYIFKYY